MRKLAQVALMYARCVTYVQVQVACASITIRARARLCVNTLNFPVRAKRVFHDSSKNQ
jgi:hypothetical protein